EICARGLDLSPTKELLIDASLSGKCARRTYSPRS
ncbi:hypothetical protein EC970007_3404, partial [Escherichia coli 97.0007]